jgi:RNA polymerase sigma-70 factor, ECF subfamily
MTVIGSATCEPVSLSRETLHHVLVPRIHKLRRYVEKSIPSRFSPTLSADDILQEVWIAAYRTLESFEPRGPDAVDRWLARIADSKITDALRAARRIKRGGDLQRIRNVSARLTSFCDLFSRLASPQKTPSSEVRADEAAHLVQIALNQLTKAGQTAIELRFVDGMSYEAIGCRLGRSEAAVHSLVFRSLRQLRGLMGDVRKYLSDDRSSDLSQTSG